MANAAIAISTPEHIEHIIKYRTRWSRSVQLRMLRDAKQKLLAFRAVKRISGEEFQRLNNAINITRQEVVRGRN